MWIGRLCPEMQSDALDPFGQRSNSEIGKSLRSAQEKSRLDPSADSTAGQPVRMAKAPQRRAVTTPLSHEVQSGFRRLRRAGPRQLQQNRHTAKADLARPRGHSAV